MRIIQSVLIHIDYQQKFVYSGKVNTSEVEMYIRIAENQREITTELDPHGTQSIFPLMTFLD